MKFKTYEPVKQEPEIQKFWEDRKIYEKSRKKNAKGPRYYYLDGPPYTTGEIHVGNTWGKALRDANLRFRTMRGSNVWNDRPGFDTHGLPIEHKVEQKLGIKNKQEIVNKIGVAKFIQECKKFAEENISPMIRDFKRLGVWLDWDNPYITYQNSYIEGAWWALKKASENGLLYEGFKSTTWCPRCATALAKHELEYENKKDISIFVKFRLAGKKDEFLIVWTTTPWTIPYNLAVMVHPDIEYVKAKVGSEIWIAAKSLIETVANGKDYKILQTMKGRDLRGLEYEHPLANEIDELKKIKREHKNAFTVVLSDKYVSDTDGSGLVHCAPGCGPEDFEVGQAYGLPAFNELDAHGAFTEKMGPYKHWKARVDDAKFIEDFERRGMILHKMKYAHEYANCWRCHTDIVYKTTKQWYLAREKLRDKMLKANSQVKWVPDWAGNRWFKSWLEGIQDWNISRQRFWGIPLPIWRCTRCDNIIVVGSADELKKLGANVPKDLHKPWIDEVKLKCPKCKSEATRVSEVLDVWLDSGASTWAAVGDSKQNPEVVADFILEGSDQIRGWFNSLMSLSFVAREKNAYKAVYMHGMINDAQGRKMSKSTHNIISPYEMIDKHGADAMRYYMIGGAKPGLDLNYNFKDMEAGLRNLNVLWNAHLYLIESAKLVRVNPAKLESKLKFATEDIYMISRLNSTVKLVTELFENYYLNEIPKAVEELFLDLSRWYIKTVREKASDENVLYVMYKVLSDLIKMMAPLTPFLAELMYQNFRDEFKLKEESIHLYDWPEFDSKRINTKLETEVGVVKELTSTIFALREKLQRSVRWPVKSAIIVTEDHDIKNAVEKQKDLIKTLANVDSIQLTHKLEGITHAVKPNHSMIAPKAKKLTTEVIAHFASQSPESILHKLKKEKKIVYKDIELTEADFMVEEKLPAGVVGQQVGSYSVYLETEETKEMLASGFARELTRAVQSLRKTAGLSKPDRISLTVSTDRELENMLAQFLKELKEKVGAKDIEFSEAADVKRRKYKESLKVKNKALNFGFDA